MEGEKMAFCRCWKYVFTKPTTITSILFLHYLSRFRVSLAMDDLSGTPQVVSYRRRCLRTTLRSAKFPFCDGSHRAHNAATGDNVGTFNQHPAVLYCLAHPEKVHWLMTCNCQFPRTPHGLLTRLPTQQYHAAGPVVVMKTAPKKTE